MVTNQSLSRNILRIRHSHVSWWLRSDSDVAPVLQVRRVHLRKDFFFFNLNDVFIPGNISQSDVSGFIWSYLVFLRDGVCLCFYFEIQEPNL